MIEIDNRQDIVEIDEDIINLIEESIATALNHEKFDKPFEVSVVITDNIGIREINAEFRNIDAPTDVLSFPMIDFSEVEGDLGICDKNPETGDIVLGDIVISIEKAISQSEEYNHSLMREISFLTVHSVLHLLGHDHEVEEERTVMRKKEEEILNILKQPR